MKAKFLVLALIAVLLLPGCGKEKTVSCDNCGEPQQVEADSKMDDSWIIYCDECYTELFGEDGGVSGN